MISPDSGELRAPSGTFQKVSDPEWRLGNVRTKRFIYSGKDTDGEDESFPRRRVVIRLRDRARQREILHYFSVDAQERVTGLWSEYFQPPHASEPNPIEPLSFNQMLREISNAERVQLTLKR